MNRQGLLYAKFLGEDILKENGRLIFAIMYAFSSSGYKIHLFDNLSHKDLGKYAQLAYKLKDLTLTDKTPPDQEEWIYLFDKEDRTLAKGPWRKKIRVKFDLFSPYFFKKPLIMPFLVHPVHASRNYEDHLDEYRDIPKKMRVFFSGDTKGYSKNRVRYPKEKLPRLEIVKTLKGQSEKEVLNVNDLSFFDNLTHSSHLNKCVVVDTSQIWVDDRKWLDILSQADFFLSPPGIVMPMCHNIIEAMAVGTIPITNYPEWFDPDLEHMKNCVVFDDKADLLEKISFVLSMEKEEINHLRKGVLSYYETYLKPAVFVKRIEINKNKTIIILMTTEGNMARKPTKLNKRSILIKGTQPTPE